MKEIKGIVAGTIFTPKEELNNVLIEFDRDYIVDMRPFNGKIPENFLDAMHMIVIPGFIDIHIHGIEGVDVTRDGYDGIKKMSKILPKYGVTSFMPTAICSSKDTLRNFILASRKLWSEKIEGAEVIGAHLEGPFINPKRKGAQPIEHIRKPDTNELQDYINAKGEMPLRLTIAPEIEGAIELINEAIKNNIIISMGHSDATFNEAEKGFKAGSHLITHLFNAMREFHHREPGLSGFALNNDNVYTEIIADFIHLHPEVLKLITRIKPLNKIILVTDAIEAAGLTDGTYQLGPYTITVKNRKATLPDGTIAGSTLTLDNAVRNITKLGLLLRFSIMMATSTPAEVLKLENIGKIKIGMKANLVILDHELNIKYTIIHGKIFKP
jgi:N-acetylglucosamine-6-phosphate deacetylase